MQRKVSLIFAAMLGLVLGIILAGLSFIMPWQQPGNLIPATPAVVVKQDPQRPSLDLPPAAATQSAAAAGTPDDSSTPQTASAASLQTPTVVPSERVTMLVLGVDIRPDEPIGRSDTMLVLSFDPGTDTTGMISLARDLLVPIPGIEGKAKINTANFFGDTNKYPGGGPELARKTVENFLGYPVDYWLRLNFDGFREIIDQIGGVDIDVAQPINDPLYPDNNYGYDPLYIPAGHIHMDGTLALKYARTRHADSDYGRARRQQQVVKTVEDKLKEPSTLAMLLPRLPVLMKTLRKSVQTNMPLDKALALAGTLARAGQGAVKSTVIDDKMGTNGSDPTWGWVLIPDMPKVRAAAASVLDNNAVAKVEPLALPSPVAEERARIAVLNGTQQKNLAGSVAGKLAGEGYNVVGTGDADRNDYAQTWLITHGRPLSATVTSLAGQFRITPDHIRAAPADSATDMVLLLGSDAAGSQAALR
jgi:polyisoprenyl-teichoic acid--peptidoglycan teichoic acid transferase